MTRTMQVAASELQVGDTFWSRGHAHEMRVTRTYVSRGPAGYESLPTVEYVETGRSGGCMRFEATDLLTITRPEEKS